MSSCRKKNPGDFFFFMQIPNQSCSQLLTPSVVQGLPPSKPHSFHKFYANLPSPTFHTVYTVNDPGSPLKPIHSPPINPLSTLHDHHESHILTIGPKSHITVTTAPEKELLIQHRQNISVLPYLYPTHPHHPEKRETKIQCVSMFMQLLLTAMDLYSFCRTFTCRQGHIQDEPRCWRPEWGILLMLQYPGSLTSQREPESALCFHSVCHRLSDNLQV